jgi:hypothetical protein
VAQNLAVNYNCLFDIKIIFGILFVPIYMMNIINEHYKKASVKLKNGSTVNDLYLQLYKFEKKEDYDACAGILKAIKEFSK